MFDDFDAEHCIVLMAAYVVGAEGMIKVDVIDRNTLYARLVIPGCRREGKSGVHGTSGESALACGNVEHGRGRPQQSLQHLDRLDMDLRWSLNPPPFIGWRNIRQT